MTGVKAAVGVGRAIVEEEGIVSRAVGGLPLVEVIGAFLDVFFVLGGERARPVSSDVSIRTSIWRDGSCSYGRVDFGSLSVEDQFFDMFDASCWGWIQYPTKDLKMLDRGIANLQGAVNFRDAIGIAQRGSAAPVRLHSSSLAPALPCKRRRCKAARSAEPRCTTCPGNR